LFNFYLEEVLVTIKIRYFVSNKNDYLYILWFLKKLFKNKILVDLLNFKKKLIIRTLTLREL